MTAVRGVLLTAGILLPLALGAQVPEGSYCVESLPLPEGHAPEVSAIAFAPDGRLYACLRLGTMWSMDTETREWRPFASGFHWPLGILPGSPGEFFVVQVPELTRVVDTDGDGRADLYETVSDRWGLGGNYHEFVSGPARDREGNFYIGLGCASSGGPLRFPVRGRLSDRPRKGEIYGHHSPVPYRGWIVKISPSGELIPFASGFRQPNGIAFSPEGELFAADNQGDWVGTSPLHHVTAGSFHGHPASLVWDPAVKVHPEELPLEVLEKRRKPPAIQLPQNDLAGSVASPRWDTTAGRFGPYAGQLFLAEWSHPRIHRIALEKVGGEYQGACFPFIQGQGLRAGNQQLAFAPDGSLYVAQVSRLWGGTGEGLQRIVWTGKTPADVLSMHLERDGFRLVFTAALDRRSAAGRAAYSLQSYRYLYHAKYGSPKVGVAPVAIEAVRVSEDAREVTLRVAELVPRRVYELRIRGLVAADGTSIPARFAAYTLNRLRE